MFLLVNSNSLSSDETRALELLLNEFPYSQVIHNLVARGYHLNDLPEKQSKLNKAAVYATDRTVLKSIIIDPAFERESIENREPLHSSITDEKVVGTAKPKKDGAVTESIKPIEKTEEKKDTSKKSDVALYPEQVITDKEEFTPSKLNGDELLDELFQDLERLKKLKHGFEVASANFDGVPPPEQAVIKKKEESKETEKPAPAGKSIIAEIKSTKKKIKPSDPKQQEQLDIIDKFIKSNPSIRKRKTGVTETVTADLAESNSVFTDNIVSETLVEILIKQGKKEKAVDVLRKLIWKFPQKKAYFAAQIEELTN